jgi:hypothetical protein
VTRIGRAMAVRWPCDNSVMRCAIDGCPEEGRHDVGMSVAVGTAAGTVETKLLVCIEHADEFRAIETASSPGAVYAS